MRLLLDEDVAIQVESALNRRGHDAIHIQTAGRKRLSDREVFDFAIAERFDALITKDRHRRGEALQASISAMRSGLRVVRLDLKGQINGVSWQTANNQIQALLDRLPDLEEILQPDSTFVRLIIHARNNRATRQTIDEIIADATRRGFIVT